MGLFRLILAIAVVIAHSKRVFYGNDENLFHSIISRENTGIYILSGHAVFVFFIISGFLMSMVINEKYAIIEKGNLKFYINRALRLYPVNFVILIAMFFYYLHTGYASYITYSLPDQSLPLTIGAFFSNLFFLGAELITFSHNENWDYVNPQIWSLSLELYFYLLAPFIVRRKLPTLVILAIASFVLRQVLFHSDVAQVPWRYFFFPSDLVFFLLGVIAHRTWSLKCVTRNIDLVKCARWISLIAMTVIIFRRQSWPLTRDFDELTSWAFFLMTAIATPLLFSLTKRNKVDIFLGHLSYPIYIGHMFVISMVYSMANTDSDRGAITVFVSLGMAMLLYLMIDKPINSFRTRVTKIKPSV